MNWWIERNDITAEITYPYFNYNDPGLALSTWRVVKLERGLVRHPSPRVRVPACRELLLRGGWGQDECWEILSGAERKHLKDGGYRCCTADEVAAARLQNEKDGADWWWREFRDRESRRLLTTMNNTRLRRQFCSLWSGEYPEDHDNGCPADRPPPATIVTSQGDVPLDGPWPQ